MGGLLSNTGRSLAIAVALTVGGRSPAIGQDVGVAGDGGLEQVLDSLRVEHGLPSLAGLSIKEDSVIEVASSGVREAGFPERATIRDRWHLGSLTKAMTATIAAVLVERRALTWQTTVGEVFSDAVDSIRPEFVNVRLEELLSHGSGITSKDWRTPAWPTLRTDSRTLRQQRERWAKEYLQLPPVTPRGTYHYANGNYVVAGTMMEIVTNTPWETLAQQELFAPLGMTESGFGAPGSATVRDQPRGHMPMSSGFRSVAPGPFADNPAALGPAGTVHATLSDYAKFVAAHLLGAQSMDGLVSAESFRRLHTATTGNYALGWVVTERDWAGGTVLTHSGSNTMWYATVWVAPRRSLAFVAVTNAGGDAAARATDRAIVALHQRVRASAH